MTDHVDSELRDLLLTQTQMDLEAEQRAAGIRAYRERLRSQDLTTLQPGQILLQRAVEAIEARIRAFAETSNPTRSGAQVRLLRCFSADYGVPAVIVARHCINALSRKSVTLTGLAVAVAKTLDEEAATMALQEQAPVSATRRLAEKVRKSTSARYTRAVIQNAENRYGIARERWDSNDRVQLGVRLVHEFAEATGLIEILRVNKAKHKDVLVVQGTQAAVEWLSQAHARCEMLQPAYHPMVVKPRPWNGVFGGGYLDTQAFGVRLIKTHSPAYLEEVDNADMPLVYRAINALQETAWRINTDVMAVMREVWDAGGHLGKLPARDGMPLPPKPADIDSNEESLKSWKRAAASVYESNARSRSKVFAMSSKLWLAERYAEFDRIYFVWSLDWRGRAYPMSPHVHPQADDSGKALLTFAERKRLGERGLWWLRVHVANLFGVDKVSYAERVAWVLQHEDRILDSGRNPLGEERFWTTADKPWQALAACVEYSRMWDWSTTTGRPLEDWESSLPVSLDGSCNGLQNFSAMLRDPVGAAATNLMPSHAPADVYGIVRDAVDRRVRQDAAAGVEGASLWLDKVDRKMVKRPVMTRPYGSAQYGMREQIEEEIKHRDSEAPAPMFADPATRFAASLYLSRVVFEAINETIVASKVCMDWLQRVARVAAKAGCPIHWVTPAGFPARQAYHEYTTRIIATALKTKRYRLTVYDAKPTINPRLQAQGIAPNFVHSMDASHMMLTINRCLARGVSAYSMVHDSYGTHAADMDVMVDELRAAFVEQYSVDVLQAFRDEVVAQLPDHLHAEIPPAPERGDFDLALVLRSDYFFS